MSRRAQRTIAEHDDDSDITCGTDCEECWFVWGDDFESDEDGKCHAPQLRVPLIEIARIT